MTTLPLSKIRTDGGTQPRAAIDFAAVDDYMDAMKDGVKFPPVIVFYDGTDYWLADGFHRREAAFGAGLEEITCDVHQGTREDAQWYSFSANKANGLRRTNEDKQRAVKAALAHEKGASLSDHQIAKHVGVDHKTVLAWRDRLESSREIPKIETRTVTRGGSTYQQNTANIGKSRQSFDGGTRVTMEAAPVVQLEEQPICDRTVAGSTPAAGSKIHVAPAKYEPQIDKQGAAVELLRAIYVLSEHKMSAAELVAMTPPEHMESLYSKTRTAYEFVGFVFDAASKRQKGVA